VKRREDRATYNINENAEGRADERGIHTSKGIRTMTQKYNQQVTGNRFGQEARL